MSKWLFTVLRLWKPCSISLCEIFFYVQDVSMYSIHSSLSAPPPSLGSSCWWRWCHCPVLWSFAGSRGGSSCLPVSPGCGLHQPTCPSFGPELKGRREEGSGTPASLPPPAPAGPVASHTPLHAKQKKILITSFSALLYLTNGQYRRQAHRGNWQKLSRVLINQISRFHWASVLVSELTGNFRRKEKKG